MRMQFFASAIALCLLSGCGLKPIEPIRVAPANPVCPALPPCPKDLCTMPERPSFLSPTLPALPMPSPS